MCQNASRWALNNRRGRQDLKEDMHGRLALAREPVNAGSVITARPVNFRVANWTGQAEDTAGKPPTMNAYATITPIPSVPSVDFLTYRVPDALGLGLRVGMRVVVPLGRRRVTGIVTGLAETAPVGIDYKDLEAVLDEQPIVDEGLLHLAAWMAEYYGTGLAEVLSLAVGRGLTAASKRTVRHKGHGQRRGREARHSHY